MLRFSALVMIADGVPDSTNESCTMDEVTFKNPVPVSINYDRPAIGLATLRGDGSNIFAEFEIENMDAAKEHAMFVGYTPAAGGTVDRLDHSSGSKVELRGMQIKEVTLSRAGNSDTRIRPLMVKAVSDTSNVVMQDPYVGKLL